MVFVLVSIAPASSSIATTDSAQKPNPIPLINQPLVPDTVAPGSGEFTLTVNGTGFVKRSVVKWNGHERATTFVSDHRLTAVIRASDIATANTASITVVNCGPGGGTSDVVFFPISFPTSTLEFSKSDLSVGDELDGLITADFNEDGIADLAAVNIAPDYVVYVFLGNGDGTFQPPVAYTTGTRPKTVASGDFNRDGHLDLVTNGRGTVCILLGNGDGTFGPVSQYGAIPLEEPDNLKTADFNGDGNLDVVIANGLGNHTVSVFLGNGDGTLRPAVAYEAAYTPVYPVVGDFNRDNILDLAVTGAELSGATIVSILLGNGDGSFQPPVSYDIGSPHGATAADFDGDCKLDLAVANYGDGTVSILRGNGDGTFQPRVDYPIDLYGPWNITTADLNADGHLDLVVNTRHVYSGTTTSVLLGNGDGNFGSSMNYDYEASPATIEGLAVADFNRDGRLDVSLSQFAAISLLLQPSLSQTARQ